MIERIKDHLVPSQSHRTNPVVISITVDWTIDPPVYKNIRRAMITLLQDANFLDVQVEFERDIISSTLTLKIRGTRYSL
jgi:hypothetical protein